MNEPKTQTTLKLLAAKKMGDALGCLEEVIGMRRPSDRHVKALYDARAAWRKANKK